MSLYRDPMEVILETINSSNGITLVPEDYDFSDPIPATPPVGSSATYNTQITITANNIAAAYQGDIDVFYNRLDLGDLAQMVDLAIKSPALATTHDILPSLNRRFGLNLQESDIELADILGDTPVKTATLTATTTSWGWIGTVDIAVSEGDLPLTDYVTETSLDGINYPTPYVNRTFAQFYSYWRDFSSEYTALSQLNETLVGQPANETIRLALANVTGDPWQLTGFGAYSLGGSVIQHVGSTSDFPGSNDSYEFVIVVRLNVDDTTELSGDLLLHFNPPEEPDEFG